MNNVFSKFIVFSSKHENIEEDINFILDDRVLKQVIYFQSDDRYKAEFVSLVLGKDSNLIEIEIDDTLINKRNIYSIEYDDEEVKITLTYPLKNNLDICLLKENNFTNIVKEITRNLKIRDVIKLNCKIKISFFDTPEYYELKLKTDWSAFNNDSEYTNKNAIILPDLLPKVLRKEFINEIFTSFIDLISERKIDDGYLIQLGSSNMVYLPSTDHEGKVDVVNIFSIIDYVFNDKYRYNDKVHILRKILTDALFDSDIGTINWFKLLQTLKDNYSLFIDEKLVEYNELRISLVSKVLEVKQKIDKSIDNKVDEFSKQILIIVATILSSFIVKIGSNNQFILIISAIVYVILILIFNLTKGIHFSSVSFKKNIEDIKEVGKNLKELEYSNDYGILNNSSNDINTSLKKLYIIEILQFALLFAITLGLIAMLVIA